MLWSVLSLVVAELSSSLVCHALGLQGWLDGAVLLQELTSQGRCCSYCLAAFRPDYLGL
jgi:hypothetical protein